ncbi:accessory Sec system glycosylation protein GtfA [Staphylococcus simulans]|uniref:accessory Sec system glycosyltransferase GtfA n=1 Tax=Staphylococcus simulans TaxID=1286 RepID=UPI0030C13A81
MTIYSINFGIGWASSGIEYAQSYRAKLLRQLKYKAKFVFLDFISSENIQTLTSNLGFKDDEIIWLYQYFSDIKIAPTTYTLDNLIKNIDHNVTYIEDHGKIQRLYLDNNKLTFATCYLKNENEKFVDRVEFVINGFLVRKDFFTYTRTFSEFYAPYNNYAKLYMRQFYNEDGTIAYREYIDNEESMYVMEDAQLYSKSEFIAYFMHKLQLTSKDMVILDRATEVGQSIIQNKGDSKVGVVVHAEHFNDNTIDDSNILWNNYYEYQFTNAKHIDFFITATDLQNKTLKRHFEKFTDNNPKIKTIPVGSLEKLIYPTSPRIPYSIITASRLAKEKHVDWIVKAVINAREIIPDITLDVYGQGGEFNKILEIINDNHAQNYIKLKGHVNLKYIYSNYKLFVSASQSEGFGLTLMEAVGSGLGLVGFNVNYGNPTFINHEKNGYLITKSNKQTDEKEIINNITSYIIKYFKNGPKTPEQTSYNIAKSFLTNKVIKKWDSLIKEVLYD